MDDSDKGIKLTLIILFVILIVVVVYSIVYNSYYLQDDVQESNVVIYNIDQLDINFGSMNTRRQTVGYDNGSMLYSQNNQKDENGNCRVGFYGPLCDQQAHVEDYYYIGSSNWQNLGLRDIDRPLNLSFKDGMLDENSCTSICNRMGDACKGVAYNNRRKFCRIVNSVPHSSDNIVLDVTAEEKILLKKKIKPTVNKVIVYSGRVPLRYYIRRRQRFIRRRVGVPGTRRINHYGVATLDKNIVYHINWKIHRIINTTGMIGIYSATPFQASNVYNIMMQAVYVDNGQVKENVPATLKLWRLEQCWVMYIPSEEFSQNIENRLLLERN